MYVLAFYLKKKDNKYIFEARKLFVCREFLAFKYISICFLLKISKMIIYICFRNLENLHLKPVFDI